MMKYALIWNNKESAGLGVAKYYEEISGFAKMKTILLKRITVRADQSGYAARQRNEELCTWSVVDTADKFQLKPFQREHKA